MTDREAMQMALEALKKATKHLPVHFDSHFEAIATLRAALEQPEPVAWTTMPEAEDWCFVSGSKDPTGKLEGKWSPLYTTPLLRKPLTDADIKLVMNGRGEEGDDDYIKPAFDPYGISEDDLLGFARAIEQAHGIGEKP